jgi:hypothetical protein
MDMPGMLGGKTPTGWRNRQGMGSGNKKKKQKKKKGFGQL